jgi:hypothetical protein
MILVAALIGRSIIAIVGLRSVGLAPGYRMAIGRWSMPKPANNNNADRI